jgi:septum formation inhibitor MinC
LHDVNVLFESVARLESILSLSAPLIIPVTQDNSFFRQNFRNLFLQANATSASVPPQEKQKDQEQEHEQEKEQQEPQKQQQKQQQQQETLPADRILRSRDGRIYRVHSVVLLVRSRKPEFIEVLST